jgi:transposase
MEAHRKEGMALLARGVTQAEVARQCEVSTPTAVRWRRALDTKGKLAWKRRPLGQPPKVQESHCVALGKFLADGAQAHGFTNDLWRYNPHNNSWQQLAPPSSPSSRRST